jgi:hypothetical protein
MNAALKRSHAMSARSLRSAHSASHFLRRSANSERSSAISALLFSDSRSISALVLGL